MGRGGTQKTASKLIAANAILPGDCVEDGCPRSNQSHASQAYQLNSLGPNRDRAPAGQHRGSGSAHLGPCGVFEPEVWERPESTSDEKPKAKLHMPFAAPHAWRDPDGKHLKRERAKGLPKTIPDAETPMRKVSSAAAGSTAPAASGSTAIVAGAREAC